MGPRMREDTEGGARPWRGFAGRFGMMFWGEGLTALRNATDKEWVKSGSRTGTYVAREVTWGDCLRPDGEILGAASLRSE